MIVLEAVDPTCTENGLTEGSHCSRCEYNVQQAVIPALGHKYEIKVTEPTCEEEGYTTYTCHCGDTYKDNYVKALGHNMVVDAGIDPTCTESGLTEGQHCTNCEYIVKQVKINPLGHNYKTTVIDPTCETKGYSMHICEICEYKFADTYKDALGHLFVQWDVIKEPTCCEKGYRQGTCSICHKVQQEEMDLLEHNASDWITDIIPTQKVDGLMHKECLDCHKILEEKVLEKMPSESTSGGCSFGMNILVLNISSLFMLSYVVFKKRK